MNVVFLCLTMILANPQMPSSNSEELVYEALASRDDSHRSAVSESKIVYIAAQLLLDRDRVQRERLAARKLIHRLREDANTYELAKKKRPQRLDRLNIAKSRAIVALCLAKSLQTSSSDWQVKDWHTYLGSLFPLRLQSLTSKLRQVRA